MDDSDEDPYMSDGPIEYSGEDEEAAAAEAEPPTIPKKPYTILKEETLKQLQESDISQASTLLAVSKGIACTLLLRHRWSLSSALDDWFANEAKVRASLGMAPAANDKRRKLVTNPSYYCKICMESVALSRALSAACGHPFCSDCWSGYLAAAVADGAACLTLRCPEPKCPAVAGLDVVEAAAAASDEFRFKFFMLRSYVESSQNRKWCPGTGCDLAVEYRKYEHEEDSYTTYDVTCDCGFKFCWRCAEEQHRPVACETVARWAEKNTSEADNTKWILAYTKSCPSCLKKIEKNQGCNHMTCKCNYEFCWHCMQVWDGYSHLCNSYEREMETAAECSLLEAQDELRRYSFYFERFTSNHKSREMAKADSARARGELVPALAAAQGVPETKLQFVEEAWEQIVECRRVLKWSYAYGYYVGAGERKKKEMFEFLQGDAEQSLERLHGAAEKEAAEFAGGAARPWAEFGDFKMKLTNLTRVTGIFFENLVRALENGLAEVGATA